MKKINLKSMRDESFGRLNADSMKKIVGGYTLPTVTVTGVRPFSFSTPSSPITTPSQVTGDGNDGDDGEVTND